jgi:hypothetical protein
VYAPPTQIVSQITCINLKKALLMKQELFNIDFTLNKLNIDSVINKNHPNAKRKDYIKGLIIIQSKKYVLGGYL